MKISLTLVLACIHSIVLGQDFVGKYSTAGGLLEIRKDSSFIRKNWYCTSYTWEQCTWSTHLDTIIFQPILVFDTVNCNGQDSIFLSQDINANRFSCDSFIALTYRAIGMYQYRSPETFKVIKLKDQLFYVGTNGKPIKRVKGQTKRIIIGKNSLDGSKSFVIRYSRKYSGAFKLEPDSNAL